MSEPSTRDEPLDERVARLEEVVSLQRTQLLGILESFVWLALSCPAILVLWKFPRPDTLLWGEVFNILHVLLSGGVALVALRLSRRLLPSVSLPYAVHVLLAAGAAGAVGVGLEVLQFVGPGDASFTDVVRDGCGAVAALAVAASTDPGWGSTAVRRWILRGGGGLLVLVALAPTARWMIPLAIRSAAFPVLATFDSDSDRRLVMGAQGATLTLESPPQEFALAQGPRAAKVEFREGQYPKLEIFGLPGDWSRFDVLVFDVYSPETQPVTLDFRVHDQRHDHTYTDRFNKKLYIPPGESTITIPVGDIRAGPEDREMSMTRIEAIVIFMVEPADPVTLFFDTFRLEKY